MKVNKAYILMIDNDVSKKYAKDAAESCDRVLLPWEYFKGYTEKDDIWNHHPVKSKVKFRVGDKGGAATASHVHIWYNVANSDTATVVLEHDAIMLHKPKLDIPDNKIVALGYKIQDPELYDHKAAGPPKVISERKHHGGAHAYALTPNTARALIRGVEERGLTNMVDNHYFLRIGSSRRRIHDVGLAITDPICALGWVRESTIWKKSVVENYKPILESFEKHYTSSKSLGLKQ